MATNNPTTLSRTFSSSRATRSSCILTFMMSSAIVRALGLSETTRSGATDRENLFSGKPTDGYRHGRLDFRNRNELYDDSSARRAFHTSVNRSEEHTSELQS